MSDADGSRDDEIAFKTKAVECLTRCALAKLVELGIIQMSEVSGNWYVMPRTARLEAEGLGAAATMDWAGDFVLYFLPYLTVDQFMETVAHESVHLAQICKGDLVPGWGYKIWKGTRHGTLGADDPDYFTKQPWEAEAREFQPVLREHLKCWMESSTQ